MSSSISVDSVNALLYEALSTPRDAFVGSKPDLSIYQFYNNYFQETDQNAYIDTPEVREHYGSSVNISYTTMGRILSDQTPLFLVLHGVPTNKKQWYPVAKFLALFGYVVCIDMLGMGMSDKPRLKDIADGWKWVHHLKYMRPLAERLFGLNATRDGPRPFIFVSDDWGSGIHIRYTSAYPQDTEKNVFLDPIAFDGYPVKEIETIGQAAGLPDVPSGQDQADFEDSLRGQGPTDVIKLLVEEVRQLRKAPLYFQHAMAGFAQTLVQILKTMTYDPNVWNQYNQRDILETYVLVDYERPGANSMTMPLRFDNIRVLTEMSSTLSPDQLLPYHPLKNRGGVRYDAVTADTLIAWGEFDNMMPTEQINRFRNSIVNAKCETRKIPRAGHFAGVDQPELVAEAIMSFLARDPAMRKRLNDVYMGFTGIWKGDERHVITEMRKIYGVPDINYAILPEVPDIGVSDLLSSSSSSSSSSAYLAPMTTSGVKLRVMKQQGKKPTNVDGSKRAVFHDY